MRVAVSFEDLVADLYSPFLCAFRVASHKACPDGWTAIGGDELEAGVRELSFESHALALATRVGGCAVKMREVAESLFNKFISACKPRPLALEWIFAELSADSDRVIVLLTSKPQVAEQVWSGWLKSIVATCPVEVGAALARVWIQDCSVEGALTSIDLLYVGKGGLSDISCPTEEAVRLLPGPASKADRVRSMQHNARNPLTSAVWRPWTMIPHIILKGKVVRGFNRGSTELGVPTANIDYRFCFGEDLHCFPLPGVYVGWCSLAIAEHRDTIYGAILNVGYCPFYANEAPSLEVHVFHKFEQDFYDAEMALDAFGFIRAEGKYADFGEFLEVMQNDCEAASSLWSPWSKETQQGRGVPAPADEFRHLLVRSNGVRKSSDQTRATSRRSE